MKKAVFIFLAILILALMVLANEKSGEEINWQVISSGGTINGTSTSYKLSGTVGQTATGSGSSTNYGLNHGFWQDFGEAGPCDCMPGDANNTGSFNILDVTCLINYLYKGGGAPIPYPLCSGDPNCTCSINILDVTCLINYLYKGGPPPCGCEEWLSSCSPPLRK